MTFDLYRYNIFTGCPEAKTCTLILRGGAEQFIEETERSLHDAIMIVRRTIKNDAVVAGGWKGGGGGGGKEGMERKGVRNGERKEEH